jgi:hypothetical protein
MTTRREAVDFSFTPRFSAVHGLAMQKETVLNGFRKLRAKGLAALKRRRE